MTPRRITGSKNRPETPLRGSLYATPHRVRDRSDDQDLRPFCRLVRRLSIARAHCEGANGPAFPPLAARGLCAYVAPMPRYAFQIEYDGAPFRGLAAAEGSALGAGGRGDGAGRHWSTRCPPSPRRGGRNAGVHATGQVAHVDMAKRWDPFRLSEAVNWHLKPAPVAIVACAEVPDDWHARFFRHRAALHLPADRAGARRSCTKRARPGMSAAGRSMSRRCGTQPGHLVGRHDFTHLPRLALPGEKPGQDAGRGDGRVVPLAPMEPKIRISPARPVLPAQTMCAPIRPARWTGTAQARGRRECLGAALVPPIARPVVPWPLRMGSTSPASVTRTIHSPDGSPFHLSPNTGGMTPVIPHHRRRSSPVARRGTRVGHRAGRPFDGAGATRPEMRRGGLRPLRPAGAADAGAPAAAEAPRLCRRLSACGWQNRRRRGRPVHGAAAWRTKRALRSPRFIPMPRSASRRSLKTYGRQWPAATRQAAGPGLASIPGHSGMVAHTRPPRGAERTPSSWPHSTYRHGVAGGTQNLPADAARHRCSRHDRLPQQTAQ